MRPHWGPAAVGNEAPRDIRPLMTCSVDRRNWISTTCGIAVTVRAAAGHWRRRLLGQGPLGAPTLLPLAPAVIGQHATAAPPCGDCEAGGNAQHDQGEQPIPVLAQPPQRRAQAELVDGRAQGLMVGRLLTSGLVVSHRCRQWFAFGLSLGLLLRRRELGRLTLQGLAHGWRGCFDGRRRRRRDNRRRCGCGGRAGRCAARCSRQLGAQQQIQRSLSRRYHRGWGPGIARTRGCGLMTGRSNTTAGLRQRGRGTAQTHEQDTGATRDGTARHWPAPRLPPPLHDQPTLPAAGTSIASPVEVCLYPRAASSPRPGCLGRPWTDTSGC